MIEPLVIPRLSSCGSSGSAIIALGRSLRSSVTFSGSACRISLLSSAGLLRACGALVVRFLAWYKFGSAVLCCLWSCPAVGCSWLVGGGCSSSWCCSWSVVARSFQTRSLCPLAFRCWSSVRPRYCPKISEDLRRIFRSCPALPQFSRSSATNYYLTDKWKNDSIKVYKAEL